MRVDGLNEEEQEVHTSRLSVKCDGSQSLQQGEEFNPDPEGSDG